MIFIVQIIVALFDLLGKIIPSSFLEKCWFKKKSDPLTPPEGMSNITHSSLTKDAERKAADKELVLLALDEVLHHKIEEKIIEAKAEIVIPARAELRKLSKLELKLLGAKMGLSLEMRSRKDSMIKSIILHTKIKG